MEELKAINKYLLDTYGKALDGKPKFRVIWSDDHTEARLGLHGPNAEVETVKEVPKYNFFRERFVLEAYTLAFEGIFGAAIRHAKGIVRRGDNYEPLRVFQTREGNFLEPDREVCKIVCDSFVALINRPAGQRLTKKQATAQDVQEMRAETQKFFELLSADDSDLIHKFRDGEAVLVHKNEVN